MSDKVEFQLLDPINSCTNPGKCYYETVKHKACGSDWIMIEKQRMVATTDNSFMRSLRKGKPKKITTSEA